MAAAHASVACPAVRRRMCWATNTSNASACADDVSFTRIVRNTYPVSPATARIRASPARTSCVGGLDDMIG